MKRKFQFRLATLQRFREWKESEKLTAYLQAQAAFKVEIEKKRAMNLRYQDALPSSHQASDLHVFYAFLEGMKTQMARQDQSIFRARKKLDLTLRQLWLAQRDRKIVDKIRERDYDVFKKDLAKFEQKQIEEQVIQRYAREEKIA
jgi:flagellar protein FliJ